MQLLRRRHFRLFLLGAAGVFDAAGENTSQDSGLRVRLDMALHDLETAQANLDLERQRVSEIEYKKCRG